MNNVTTVVSDLDSIVLKKLAKGNFTYEIKCYGDTITNILAKIENARFELDKKYGENNNALE